MDRRWRAARDGGLVLVVTAVVATILAQRDTNNGLVPQVTVLDAPTRASEHVEFLVRGAGCAAPGDSEARKRIRKRIEAPTTQYRGALILVRFRVEDPGSADPCRGPDPGTLASLTLATPLGDRTLADANTDPPVPFTLEKRP